MNMELEIGGVYFICMSNEVGRLVMCYISPMSHEKYLHYAIFPPVSIVNCESSIKHEASSLLLYVSPGKKGTSPPSSGDNDGPGPIGLVNNGNGNSGGKRARNGSGGSSSGGVQGGNNNLKNKPALTQLSSVVDADPEPYQTINSLEVAVEYLKTFLESPGEECHL
jgi:hypothetical protein